MKGFGLRKLGGWLVGRFDVATDVGHEFQALGGEGNHVFTPVGGRAVNGDQAFFLEFGDDAGEVGVAVGHAMKDGLLGDGAWMLVLEDGKDVVLLVRDAEGTQAC